jgi:hypothetical protein
VEVCRGCILAVVLSLRSVLALGAAGSDPVSDRVAVAAAISVGWNRSPRSARPRVGGSDVARALVERAIQVGTHLRIAIGT